jgi:hypothetical protein
MRVISQNSIHPIPVETARAAQAVFGKSNLYLLIGDQVRVLFSEIDLTAFAHPRGKSPILFPLVTLFQYLENLPDRRAAEAFRMRVDWKYALHMPLVFPSLDPHELCSFRSLLLHEKTKINMFQRFLDRLKEVDLYMSCESSELQAGPVLQKVCALSRLEEMVEAMHQALEVFAALHPEWLRAVTLPHWYERYYRSPVGFQLPASQEDQDSLTISVGRDAQYLIEAADEAFPAGKVPGEVQNLFRTWTQHFYVMDGQTVWRTAGCTSC